MNKIETTLSTYKRLRSGISLVVSSLMNNNYSRNTHNGFSDSLCFMTKNENDSNKRNKAKRTKQRVLRTHCFFANAYLTDKYE